MTAHDNHESVAKALATDPPVPDDLTRARMEKRLLEAASRRGTPAAPASPSRAPWIAGGVAIVAAAAALLWLAQPSEPEAAPVAHLEVRDIESTAHRGTIEEGSVLRTDADQVADIRIGASSVHLEPGSELVLSALRPERLGLELVRGEIRVEFHPERRGEEHLDVTTAQARVEVVGTVFTVRADEASTEVAVTEGRVRVVRRDGGGVHSVGAGESLRVGEAVAQAEPEVEEPAQAPEPVTAPNEDVPAETVAQETGPNEVVPAEVEERAAPPARPSASARLAEARQLLRDPARRADAEATLREIGGSSAPARVRAEALSELGDLLGRARRVDDAARAYESAASLNAGPMSSMAIYSLARLRERNGDRTAARASYGRYLEAAPEGALAAQTRAALCRLGDAARCAD